MEGERGGRGGRVFIEEELKWKNVCFGKHVKSGLFISHTHVVIISFNVSSLSSSSTRVRI